LQLQFYTHADSSINSQQTLTYSKAEAAADTQLMLLIAGKMEEALFVYNDTAACYWYNTKLVPCGAVQQQYYLAGWLAGQALHNRTDLGIRLAPLLWQKVLEGDSFQASALLPTSTHLTLGCSKQSLAAGESQRALEIMQKCKLIVLRA